VKKFALTKNINEIRLVVGKQLNEASTIMMNIMCFNQVVATVVQKS